LWDVLWLLHVACSRAAATDRVHFEVLVDVAGDGRHELVRLWARFAVLVMQVSRY
jgi:hypothetical protein